MKKSAEKCRFLLNKGGESVNFFNSLNFTLFKAFISDILFLIKFNFFNSLNLI